MKRSLSRLTAFVLVLALILGVPLAVRAEAATKAKKIKPTISQLHQPKFILVRGDEYYDSYCMLYFAVDFDAKGRKGKLYAEVYGGGKRVYREVIELEDTMLDEGYYTASEYLDGGIPLQKNNGDSALKSGKSYTVKVYLKTDWGKSKVFSSKLTAPTWQNPK